MSIGGFDPLPGERVLWSGAPKRFPVFTPADRVLVPFSLVWTGFAVFWIVQAKNLGADDLFVLPGYVFVVIGSYLVAGRLVVRAVGLRRTRYLVTSRRVVILRGGRERSSSLTGLGPPRMTVAADGTGSIEFGDRHLLDLISAPGWRGRTPNPWGEPFMLRGIEHPRRVLDLIASARAES